MLTMKEHAQAVKPQRVSKGRPVVPPDKKTKTPAPDSRRREKFSSNSPVSLAGKAYREIRIKILKGEFSVETVLSRRQIARELQMSLPPVYEAIQQLESEGLLESKSRVGTRLRIPTRQDVLDRGMVREALESQSARLFAERATSREKKELLRMGAHLDRLYTQWEGGKVDRDFLYALNTYHLNLHLRIAECARSPALREAIEREQVLIFNWFYDTVAQRRVLGRDFHARLASALVSGKPAVADAAMRHHIRFGMGEALAMMGNLKKSPTGWRLRKGGRIALDSN
jgi:DNA-binding GntR family transcriptional regulator